MKRMIPYAVLAAWLCIQTTASFYVLKQSKIARVYDEQSRIVRGLLTEAWLFEDVRVSYPARVSYVLTLGSGQYHPPLFEIMEAASWYILRRLNSDDEGKMVLMTNTLFLGILIFSTYGIGASIGNKTVGILSALCVSSLPMVFGHSRVAMLDFPLMCMATLSILFLLKTRHFSLLKYSVALGVCLGLSQLTKESAVLFFSAPLLYYFFRAYSLSTEKKKTVRNFFVTLFFFVFVTGIVYLRPENMEAFFIYFKKIYYIRHQPDPLFYLKGFKHLTGIFVLAISLPLLLAHIFHAKHRDKLLLLWCFVPVILFSISANKTYRFLLPVVPAFILVLFYELHNKNLFAPVKRAYAFALIAFSLMQYVLLNFGHLDATQKYNSTRWGIMSVKQDRYADVPGELLGIFRKEASLGPARTILFLFNVGQIHSPLFIQLVKYNLPFKVMCMSEADIVNRPRMSELEKRKTVMGADYVVWSDTHFDTEQSLDREFQALFLQCKGSFSPIAEVTAVDDARIVVYKRNS